MNDKQKAEQLLRNAYALETPDDNVEYYKDFADIYDKEFADSLGYLYPKALAEVYKNIATDNDIPILDVGCGTGLVAQELSLDPQTIDGVDISPDMLKKSKDKNLYRHLFEVDLTQSMADLPTDYGAVTSSGTFTHGHLRPEILEDLLSVVRPNALFCVGVNSKYFEKMNFDRVLNNMYERQLITEPKIEVVKVFSQGGSDHGQDTANVLLFRKL